MLTGIPPFYHKDGGERRRKIIEQDLQLPVNLPSTDILTKLLDKDPTRRLGANGVAEVKAHPFFHDVEWDGCLQREFITPFKPYDAATVFWHQPNIYQPFKRPKRERRETKGTVYEHLTGFPSNWWLSIGSVKDKGQTKAADKKASLNPGDDDGWELMWEPAAQKFLFRNRLTDERITAEPEDPVRAKEFLSEIEHPSKRQKKEALAVTLKAGYSKHVFSQILGYGTNLNVHILDYDQTPEDTEFEPYMREEVPVTPLEWVAEHERLDIVNLFLDSGADTNFTACRRYGPALLKAVKRKHQRLVDILVPKTDRMACTRALALAVEQQDITTTNTLLAHDVRCDFEESDRPLPEHPRHLAGATWARILTKNIK